MSIFGPPDKDPLLQDDPLAPSADDQHSFSEESSGAGEEGPDTSRLLVQSMADAQNGKLDGLNRALARGWSLERVDLNPEGTLAFVLRRPHASDGPDTGR